MNIILKQTNAFTYGLIMGIEGYSLSIDRRKNNYKKLYNQKAFDYAYDLMQSVHYEKIWLSTPKNILPATHLLKHVLLDKKIKAIDWEIYFNWRHDTYCIEPI